MKSSVKSFKLVNGQEIPAIGLGTWRSTEEEAYNAVITALNAGYRHIDTAAGYGNEEPIGRAIRDSKIPREQLFITTKLWGTWHHDPETALKNSLKKLGLSYVDLYLMHWPIALNPNGNNPSIPTRPDGLRDILYDWSFVKTYKLMEPLVGKGMTKSIGVSNCSVKYLTELLSSGVTVFPAVNQVELHPYLPQHDLLKYCSEKGIILEAYSPLGSSDSPLLKDEIINKIADKYEVSSATVLISWGVWRGTVVLPKSVSAKRIESNLQLIELKDEDGRELDGLAEKRGGPQRFVSPPWDPIKVFE